VFTCILLWTLYYEETKTASVAAKEEHLIDKVGTPLQQLSLWGMLKITRALFGFIIQFLAYFILSFNAPLLNTHLDKLGYKPSFISVSISSVALTYAMTIPLVQLLTTKASRRSILFFGTLVMTLAMVLTG